jgi:negative regulator of flagellin synthesis FlgM
MTIERLGPIDPVSKYNKTDKASRPAQISEKDSIDVSEEAKLKAEMYRALESVRMSPEIREDRVAEVKRKLEDPDYINKRVIEVVADRVLDMFKI